jgi:uncharacterized protein (DUF1501 family)
MFQINKTFANCQEISRRPFLQVGALSLFGLTLPRLLAARAAQGAETSREMNCILLFTAGGMSNVDTLDMKPDAPIEYRGEFKALPTKIPGQLASEHLPRMAESLNKVCLVKSIVHAESGDHAAATHYMLTGYPQRPDPTGQPAGSTIYPMFGSVVAKERGWKQGMPANVQVGEQISYSGAGYLGSRFNPLAIRSDPNAADFNVEDVSIPAAIGETRTARRQRLLSRLDAWQQATEKNAGSVLDRSEFYRQAFSLMTSPAAKKAFNIKEEPDKVRDRYGRNATGQGVLLARRLIESGVRFVSVISGGWDTHDNNFGRLKTTLLPTLDQCWSALLEDLSQRGLLESTLVICAGEFGRTPKVNAAAGRDHYAPCNVVGLSGGRVAMGSVVGQTDGRCERVSSSANSTVDYAATIYRLLGIDETREYISEDGRPIRLINGGKPITGVIR